MPHEILTPEQMYRADALAVRSGVKSLALMERAGAAVAHEVSRRFKRKPVLVLCGPGNNGGDGFVAARLLKRKGVSVRLLLLGKKQDLKGDAAIMAGRWTGPIEAMEMLAACLQAKRRPGVIIDALFGAGLSRDFPQGLAETINGAGLPIVAVDVPSGLDGLTGRPRGACVKADVTVTFFCKKPAHVLAVCKMLCGDVQLADIGIPDAVLDDIKPQLWENARPQWPELAPATHKYKRGHALVVSGPRFNTGAARLAAMAAQRAGAGLVTIAGDVQALSVHAAHVSSIMLCKAVQPLDLTCALTDVRINSVCIGPASGVGVETMAKVHAVLGSSASAVLDADALTSFVQNPDALFELIRQRSASVILTPHEGEFSKLFNGLRAQSDSKIEQARQAARMSGSVILCKGPDTVIAAPDGRARVNTNAPPSLATAGSGDVLAGLISGLLAQGMPAFEAACAGAWLHGNTAAHLPLRGLIAEDLIQNLRFDE